MDELLIKNGTVIDGTGAPRKQADVLIAGDRIKAVGKGLGTTGQVVDADGLVVIPGIIDPHTHMDGQFFFEPKGTSSSWHGVTTVLMGHCGYSMAPIRPEHKDYIIHMFARVEEVPPTILENYLPWDWETFPQYLDSLDRGLGINAVSQVGHSTLRYYVMGPDAIKRKSTDAEVLQMRKLLRESLDAGAFGFTTSRSPSQMDWSGGPVPSRWAGPEEVIELASELKSMNVGCLGLIPAGLFAGKMTDEDIHVILSMAKRSGGKPIQINGSMKQDTWQWMHDVGKQGATVYGVAASQPPYRFWTLQDGTNVFNSLDTWFDVWKKPLEERLRLYGSPELRPTLRNEVDGESNIPAEKLRRNRINWAEMRIAKAHRPENRHLEGTSILDLSTRQSKHRVDTLLDFAQSEDWKTLFITRHVAEAKWLDKERGAFYRMPNVYPMNTDAGAHLHQECKTGEATYFLKKWVMDLGVMSLEEGVRKVTSQAAKFIGLPDRGVIKEGMAADIAVFDLQNLDCLTKEPLNDLPDGSRRWIQRATGVKHVFVNGVAIIKDGKEAGALPGKVIRSSWYRS